MPIFVYIIIGTLIGITIAFVVIKFVLPQTIKTAVEQLVLIANDKLTHEKQEIKTDLDNKKAFIEDLVKRIREDLEKSKEKLEGAEKERIGSFRALRQEIESQRLITKELSTTTENLKKVLSNNQLRGQFGEQVAENLLQMAGFVRGVDYEFNKEQEGIRTRPDFTIYLPNKVKINVDAKFPYSHLQKAVETQDLATKKEYLKLFERDVREKIKQVTNRDYINPENNTVDFVIMFVPNEMIFSYIYDKMSTVWTEAMKSKVVLAGPFSFTATLRLVRQAYDNFRYQKNVQKIIGYIKVFETEFAKYSEEFDKLGSRIVSVSDQYSKIKTTRTNQLLKSIEKIKLDEPNEEKNLLLADKT